LDFAAEDTLSHFGDIAVLEIFAADVKATGRAVCGKFQVFYLAILMQNKWVADIDNTLSIKALRNVQNISANIFETGFAAIHFTIIHYRPFHIMTVENGNIAKFFG
jgi:hypothetical protein